MRLSLSDHVGTSVTANFIDDDFYCYFGSQSYWSNFVSPAIQIWMSYVGFCYYMWINDSMRILCLYPTIHDGMAHTKLEPLQVQSEIPVIVGGLWRYHIHLNPRYFLQLQIAEASSFLRVSEDFDLTTGRKPQKTGTRQNRHRSSEGRGHRFEPCQVRQFPLTES